MYWTSDSKRKEYGENIWKWKSMGLSFAVLAVSNKKYYMRCLKIESASFICWKAALLMDAAPLQFPAHIVIMPLCITGHLKKNHLREEDASPSAATSSPPPSLFKDAGPHSACWPWWLEDPSHPLFCLFCNKMGCFPLLLQKFTQDPPLRIVAFPCIDVWLVVHIHLLFYALDFKENERGPIMLIGSCSVKRNQGLVH